MSSSDQEQQGIQNEDVAIDVNRGPDGGTPRPSDDEHSIASDVGPGLNQSSHGTAVPSAVDRELATEEHRHTMGASVPELGDPAREVVDGQDATEASTDGSDSQAMAPADSDRQATVVSRETDSAVPAVPAGTDAVDGADGADGADTPAGYTAYSSVDTDDDDIDVQSLPPIPAGPATPIVIGRADVSRETEFDPYLDDDTPIGRAARQAIDVQQGELTLPRPRHRRVFTVANQKGGVGKTTTTVNIGVALALAGLHVLVIDLDPQGNASTALGAERVVGTPSIYEVLVGDIEAGEAIQTCPEAPRLGVLPATIDLAGAEIELVNLESREYRLKRAIDGIKGEYDYIFIDCPPSLGLLTINAMTATEEVLIPIQCEYYALEGLGQLLNNIALVQQHLNTSLEVSTILLTMYDGRTKLAGQVADEVRNHFGDKVLDTVIPRSVKVSEAPGFGQSVITYDAGSRGAMSYLDAAREIAHRGAKPAATAAPEATTSEAAPPSTADAAVSAPQEEQS